MADTKTPFYALVNPEVGGSSDSWGTKENADRTTVDLIMAVPRPAIAVSTSGEFDLDDGVVQQITVDGDKTLTIVNTPVAEDDGLPVSTFLWLNIINGGAHTVDWSGIPVVWASGVEPTLKVSGVDLLLLVTGDEGAGWNGYHIGTNDEGTITAAMLAPGVAGTLFTGVLGRATVTGPVILTSFGTITIPGATLSSVFTKARIRACFSSDFVGNPLRVKFGSATVVDTVTKATPTVIEIDVNWKTSATQDFIATVMDEDGNVLSLVAGTIDTDSPVIVDFQGNPQGGSALVMHTAAVEVLDGTP